MKKLVLASVLLLLLAAAIVLVLQRSTGYDWELPENLPPPAVPADNPMSAAKIELGRWLFHDNRLSVNETMSCASCHIQSLAFTDGKARSVGATGELHPRSSMSLVNTAYASRLTWANQLLDRIEDQMLTPIFGDKPIEMGMAGKEERIVDLLRNDPRYAELVARAFPEESDPYSIVSTVRAIAAFVRSIVSYESPYDRYLRGETGAINAAAVRGMELFFSERLECFHCHGGFNFTDSTTHANSRIDRVGFHNTGLYNLDGEGRYPDDNTGLFDMTGNRRDMGRFKAPTLRNIAVTAPYMHDGSAATLDDVISHYANGGRVIEKGEFAGDGKRNPYKSEFMRGFALSASERADLIAFLESLTDDRVLHDPRWSNPFIAESSGK
jgi:cytochrome c peroxidase